MCSRALLTCLNVGGAVPGLLGRLLTFGGKEWKPESAQVVFIVSGGPCEF